MGRAVAQLRNEVRKLTTPSGQRPFVMETVDEILFGPLPEHLLAMLLRTLTLELHVARLQGRLHGETSEERFESFVRLSEQPEYAMEFFREYPVLARQIVNCLDHWLSASLEFLERWCADWPAIRSSFSPGADPGPLVGKFSRTAPHRLCPPEKNASANRVFEDPLADDVAREAGRPSAR